MAARPKESAENHKVATQETQAARAISPKEFSQRYDSLVTAALEAENGLITVHDKKNDKQREVLNDVYGVLQGQMAEGVTVSFSQSSGVTKRLMMLGGSPFAADVQKNFAPDSIAGRTVGFFADEKQKQSGFAISGIEGAAKNMDFVWQLSSEEGREAELAEILNNPKAEILKRYGREFAFHPDALTNKFKELDEVIALGREEGASPEQKAAAAQAQETIDGLFHELNLKDLAGGIQEFRKRIQSSRNSANSASEVIEASVEQFAKASSAPGKRYVEGTFSVTENGVNAALKGRLAQLNTEFTKFYDAATRYIPKDTVVEGEPAEIAELQELKARIQALEAQLNGRNRNTIMSVENAEEIKILVKEAAATIESWHDSIDGLYITELLKTEAPIRAEKYKQKLGLTELPAEADESAVGALKELEELTMEAVSDLSDTIIGEDEEGEVTSEKLFDVFTDWLEMRVMANDQVEQVSNKLVEMVDAILEKFRQGQLSPEAVRELQNCGLLPEGVQSVIPEKYPDYNPTEAILATEKPELLAAYKGMKQALKDAFALRTALGAESPWSLFNVKGRSKDKIEKDKITNDQNILQLRRNISSLEQRAKRLMLKGNIMSDGTDFRGDVIDLLSGDIGRSIFEEQQRADWLVRFDPELSDPAREIGMDGLYEQLEEMKEVREVIMMAAEMSIDEDDEDFEEKVEDMVKGVFKDFESYAEKMQDLFIRLATIKTNVAGGGPQQMRENLKQIMSTLNEEFDINLSALSTRASQELGTA